MTDDDQRADSDSAMQIISAAQLRITDTIEQDDDLQTVTSIRLQGAPPEVSVGFAGVAGRRQYLPTARLRVVRRP